MRKLFINGHQIYKLLANLNKITLQYVHSMKYYKKISQIFTFICFNEFAVKTSNFLI